MGLLIPVIIKRSRIDWGLRGQKAYISPRKGGGWELWSSPTHQVSQHWCDEKRIHLYVEMEEE